MFHVTILTYIPEGTWSKSLAVSPVSNRCSLLGPGLRCLRQLCIYSAFGQFGFLPVLVKYSPCPPIHQLILYICPHCASILTADGNIIVIVIVAFQQYAGCHPLTVPHTGISAMVKKKMCDIGCLASQCQK